MTLEPEPGEEQVYGDATTVIVEWRRVRAEFTEAGGRLGRAVAEERMRELEIAMIEEHGLTLPPAAYPWDGFDRRSELWSRRQALERVRVERARAQLWRWLRRVLTLRTVAGPRPAGVQSGRRRRGTEQWLAHQWAAIQDGEAREPLPAAGMRGNTECVVRLFQRFPPQKPGGVIPVARVRPEGMSAALPTVAHEGVAAKAE